jgi:hypothetical protein
MGCTESIQGERRTVLLRIIRVLPLLTIIPPQFVFFLFDKHMYSCLYHHARTKPYLALFVHTGKAQVPCAKLSLALGGFKSCLFLLRPSPLFIFLKTCMAKVESTDDNLYDGKLLLSNHNHDFTNTPSPC